MSAPGYDTSMKSGPPLLLPFGCVLFFAACSGSQPAVAPVAIATLNPATAGSSGGAAFGASGAATSAATATAATVTTAARLTTLERLRCVGQWRDTEAGSAGAFSARVESGAGGGVVTFEVGGSVFGGSGGVFQAAFRQSGDLLVLNQRSEFLGQVQAAIDAVGNATATMIAPPALGSAAKVTLADASYSPSGVLRFWLNIDAGGGRAVTRTTVEAACAKQ